MKKDNCTIVPPHLDDQLLSKLVVISYSKNFDQEYDKLTDEEKATVKEKVMKYCYNEYSETNDYRYAVLCLTNNGVWELVSKVITKRFGYHKEYAEIHELISHAFNEVLKWMKDDEKRGKYDPERGVFSMYIRPLIIGAANDKDMQDKKGMSFPDSKLRTAKQFRDKLVTFYNGDIPNDVETIVREYFQIDETKTNAFLKKCEFVRENLSFFDFPISIYTEMLNGEGDELIDILEGNGETPLDVLLKKELGGCIKVLKSEFDEKVLRAYLKFKTKKVNTEFPMTKAVEYTGVNKGKLNATFDRISARLRELIEGTVRVEDIDSTEKPAKASVVRVTREDLKDAYAYLKEEFGEEASRAFVKANKTNTAVKYSLSEAAKELNLTVEEVVDLFNTMNAKVNDFLKDASKKRDE
ncbi:MAG: hypothetical protein IJS93_01400 [Clostridia bacterium]|nr:hypothetical protein [Clostridia bacterium]